MNLSKRVEYTNKLDYYTMHLLIINPFLPVKLNPREIEVLACFMSLSGDLVEKDRLCTSARKEVRDKLNLSYGGLGNYIKKFSDNKFIKYDEDGNAYIPYFLYPQASQQNYSFTIAYTNGNT